MKINKNIDIKVHAKPIVEDQFWVLTDGSKRVGEINKANQGYNIKVGNKIINYRTINILKVQTDIEFDSAITREQKEVNQVHDYPTDAEPYNGVWSLQQKAPIFTKELHSKSWYAAGWYLVKQNKFWRQDFCPKLITLQRYEYRGPFKNQEDMIREKA
tara:strand:- start:93 stop:566 length:474 start_codon:yes stop_codon:yes gene_type:complete